MNRFNLDLSYISFYEEGGDFDKLLSVGVAERDKERKEELRIEARDLQDRQAENERRVNSMIALVEESKAVETALELLKGLKTSVTDLSSVVNAGKSAVTESTQTIAKRNANIAALQQDLKNHEEAEHRQQSALDVSLDQLGTLIARNGNSNFQTASEAAKSHGTTK